MTRFGALLLCGLMVAAAVSAHAAEMWGAVLTLSPTTSLSQNRLCYSDGRDIACNATAPYLTSAGLLGIGTTSPTTALQVSGATILERSQNDVSTTVLSLQNNANSATPGTALEFQVLNVNARAYLIYQYYSGSFDFSIRTPEWGQTAKTRYGIYHTADGTNTYQYWNRANGTEAMRLSHGGLLGIGTTNPTTTLEVSGTISATNLLVNGVAVTGGSGSSGDRIVSTSANVVAYAGGTISLTTGGVSGTAYFDTAGRLVVPGISATTAQASFTSVYASGNVGIGTTAPSATLMIADAGLSTSYSLVLNNRFYFRGDGVMYWGQVADAGFLSWNAGIATMGARSGKDLGLYAGSEKIRIKTTGEVGIGTTNPNATLEVNGTISATNLLVNGVPVTGGGTSDRIVSGSVSAIAQQSTGAVQVSGSVSVSGSVLAIMDTCNPGKYGAIASDGAGRLFVCRQQ